MLVICDKCNSQTDVKMDRDTDKVICPDCGGEVESLTSFALQAMKTNKDFLPKNTQSFSFMCKKCEERKAAVVNKEGTSVICTECKTMMPEVSAFMLSTMKNLGYNEQ